MRRLRKTTWCALVVATAFSTLAANTPFVVCACAAAANVKPEVAEAPTCCCGTSCCAPVGDEGTCCNPPQSSQPEPIDGTKMQAPECAMELTPTPTLSVEERQANAGDIVVVMQFADTCMLGEPRVAAPFPLSWHVYRVPPPTDLLVLLQHFNV